MMNRKRASALMLSLTMILVLFVSSAFIAHEAGHDCSGESCPICQMIAMNVDMLRTLGLALLIVLALFAIGHGRFAHPGQGQFCPPVSGTLVSWKIRLNN